MIRFPLCPHVSPCPSVSASIPDPFIQPSSFLPRIYKSRMSCMSPQFIYQLRLDYCCHYLSARDLSLPPRRASASRNCLTLVTLLFDFAHYREPSRLILRLYNFLTTRRTCIYLPLSEIPGPRQKAGAAHELKPLSIPPIASGNLRDPVFAPGSLGLTRNTPPHMPRLFIPCDASHLS